MALTVDQLYELILNRQADPGGRQFWQEYTSSRGTPGIDPEELDAFISGAQSAGERVNSSGTQQVLGMLSGPVASADNPPSPNDFVPAFDPANNPGIVYTPQTRDVDQGVAAQTDYSIINPRTSQLENVEPASNYIPNAPANQFVVSSGRGVFEQDGKRFQPVNLVTVDAQGNVIPSGTFNIEKNELSDFAKIVGTGTKLAATALSAYAIGSSILNAAGLGGTAAGTAAASADAAFVAADAAQLAAQGLSQAQIGQTLVAAGVNGSTAAAAAAAAASGASAATIAGQLGAGNLFTATAADLAAAGITAGNTFTAANAAALNSALSGVTPPVTPAPPSVTPPLPPPGTPPTQTVTVTAPRPVVPPTTSVPPIVPIVPITPGGTPTTTPTNQPPANDPNTPSWLLSLMGLAGGADKLLSSASPLLSALSSNEAAKNTIEALRSQGALAKSEYRSLADEASRDVSFTPYGVSTGLFSTTRPTTTGVFESTLNPQTQALVDAANAASLGSFEQAGTADLNQMAADRMALYQQLVSPEQQRSRLAQEARLQAQGRLGVGAGGGEYAPELRALEDAIAKQNLQFALAAPQEALAQRSSLISQGQAAGQLPLGISQQQLSALQLGGQLGQQQAQTAYQRGGLLGQLAGTGISENLMAQLAAAQVQAERDKALATAFSGMGNRSGSGGGMFTDILNFGKDLYNFGRSI